MEFIRTVSEPAEQTKKKLLCRVHAVTWTNIACYVYLFIYNMINVEIDQQNIKIVFTDIMLIYLRQANHVIYQSQSVFLTTKSIISLQRSDSKPITRYIT